MLSLLFFIFSDNLNISGIFLLLELEYKLPHRAVRVLGLCSLGRLAFLHHLQAVPFLLSKHGSQEEVGPMALQIDGFVVLSGVAVSVEFGSPVLLQAFVVVVVTSAKRRPAITLV